MANSFLLFLCFILTTTPAMAANPPITLLTAQQQVMAEFSRLDTSLKKAARELGTTGLSGTEARRVLADTCKEFNHAIDCCTVDTTGKMVTVEPARYRRFEGKDISDQDQVIRMLQLNKPIVSSVFRSVEGDDAVDIEYPVFSSDRRFIGAVSILLNPERLLGDIIKPLVYGVPLDIWAMDKSGRILYDVDPSQIGLNLFTSPLYQPYTHLVRLGKKMARSSHGIGSYRFKAYKTGRDVLKKTYWQSVSLYGTDWRLIGIHVEPEVKKERAVHPRASFNPDKELEHFAEEAPLKTALAEGNQDEAMQLFKMFYEATPGIYAVEWIDSKGVNRFGYPTENSLIDYDFRSVNGVSDPETARIVEKRQPATFEAPLLEGRTGSFVFKPVFKDGQYLGMVYSIRLKTQ